MSHEPTVSTITLEVPATVAPVPTGHEPLSVTMRLSFTPEDRQRYVDRAGTNDRDEMQELTAPFVVAWNLEGEAPPAEAGPGQLDRLPFPAVIWIVTEVNRRIAQLIRGYATTIQTPSLAPPPRGDC